MATVRAAAAIEDQGDQHEDEKESWQPGIQTGGATTRGRLPAHMNIDEGAVDTVHASLAVT
jgi:hypothetical protein